MALQGITPTHIEIDGIPQPLADGPDYSDDTLSHLWCECEGSDIALCGADIFDVEEVDLEEVMKDSCVVCSDLNETHDDFCPLNNKES